jgi:hypothetical protein
MKNMPYPVEAAAMELLCDRMHDWSAAELRAARWVGEQQAGGDIVLATGVRPATQRLMLELAATGRPVVPRFFVFDYPPLRHPNVGLIVLDGLLFRTKEATEWALDYFAGQPQPGGIILWMMRAPSVTEYLERELVPYFDVARIIGTRLAMLDLACLDPRGPQAGYYYEWSK